MRDLIVALIVFGALPFVVMRPHIGVLLFSWLSYMNPHRSTWGFAYSFPFAAVAAIVTMVSLLFSKEPKRIPITPVTVFWMLFVIWTCISTYFALVPENALLKWDRSIKIQVMVLLTLVLITNRERLYQLIWVIVVSLGFYGVKGGLFAIATQGQYRVWGPPESFVEGNNELALALIMILPLMRFLQLQMQGKWVKRAFTFAMILCCFAILASYSRGAFLAGGMMVLAFWWKSRRKFAIGAVLAALVSVGVAFMPAEWTERMHTIKTYQEDDSALGRLNSWAFAINLANDRPLVGGGFRAFDPNLFHVYAPDPNDFHDAHSIYFEVLGEQGYVGLLFFLLMWIATYMTGSWVIRHVRPHAELAWAADLSAMVQAGLVGYAVGGAFLGLAYYDLPYHFMAILVLTQVIVKRELALKAQPSPSAGTAASPLMSGPMAGWRR